MTTQSFSAPRFPTRTEVAGLIVGVLPFLVSLFVSAETNLHLRTGDVTIDLFALVCGLGTLVLAILSMRALSGRAVGEQLGLHFAVIIVLLLLGGLQMLRGVGVIQWPVTVEEPAIMLADSPTPEPAPVTKNIITEFFADGEGDLSGRVLWNNVPVADLQIVTCQGLSSYAGCGDEQFTTRTDGEGHFAFSALPAGKYGLGTWSWNGSELSYLSGDFSLPAAIAVSADSSIEAPDWHLYKKDIELTYPIYNETVVPGKVTLSWKPYPDAAYYEIYLTMDKGDAIFVTERVNGERVSAELMPINCSYTWNLEAFNADGHKIAEYDGFSDFRVDGGDADCDMLVHEPLNGTRVDGRDLLLDWETQPMAATYRILMWRDTDDGTENILDFVTVPESRYQLEQTLKPGRYVWSVDAYDGQGRQVGETEIVDFIVE
jgi:hypothetical protein